MKTPAPTLSATPFGKEYADAYDALYGDKDYALECDILEKLLAKIGTGGRRLLDLGCGTGGHAITFATRGYSVVAVDRSEAMLAEARRKSEQLAVSTRPELYCEDIRRFAVERTFDVALLMFAVLGYHLGNDDVLAALATARRHLRPGGLVVFDVWYGPAVLSQRPSDRVKVIELPDRQILRCASPSLISGQQRCRVDYRVWRFEDGRLQSEARESHEVRYFFPLELDLFLRCAGFSRVHLSAFPQTEREASDATWNVLVVGRAE